MISQRQRRDRITAAALSSTSILLSLCSVLCAMAWTMTSPVDAYLQYITRHGRGIRQQQQQCRSSSRAPQPTAFPGEDSGSSKIILPNWSIIQPLRSKNGDDGIDEIGATSGDDLSSSNDEADDEEELVLLSADVRGRPAGVVLEDLDWRVMKLKLEEENTRRFLKAGPRFLPYDEARKWVQAWGQRWTSEKEWNSWIEKGEKRNSYIPSRPEEYYRRRGKWISWVSCFVCGVDG
jgi:hypothetical protein